MRMFGSYTRPLREERYVSMTILYAGEGGYKISTNVL
jgi:hypothetical protein